MKLGEDGATVLGLDAAPEEQMAYDEGWDDGYIEGYDAGYDQGESDGFTSGRAIADREVRDAYDDGYLDGERDTIQKVMTHLNARFGPVQL